MSIWKLTTLGIAILLLTFAGSISPGAVSAQQTSACTTGGAVPDAANNPGLVSDCAALLAARDTLAGTATLNWAADTPMSEWDGVSYQGTPERVTELLLSSRSLTGRIPSELGNLSNLETLFLTSNQLTGEIPTELGNLSNLTVLSLFGNQLTGEIPTELGNLSSLTELFLSINQLTGEIPTELGNLSNLTRLSLPINQLTGKIPTELGNLSNLQRLGLSGNQLTGEIPTELGNLSNLQRLHLSINQLTGEIPTELGNLSNLQRLNLRDNRLTGELPQSLTGLTVLVSLSFYNNAGLCAPIDEAFQIWLQSVTSVSGSSCVPMDSAEDRAVLVELYNATDGANWTNNTNWLSDRPIREWHGVINDADGRVTEVILFRNQLTGEIPTELGNLSNLTGLYLNDNQLTGELPQTLTGLTALASFTFGNNAGLCAPTDEAFQTWLQSVSFVSGDNCVAEDGDSAEDRAVLVELYNDTGGANWTDNTNWLSDEPMREWHGVVTDDEGRVAELSLDDNQLSGEIPTELGNLSNLQSLYLNYNQLTGEMPTELGNLSNLETLDLGGNQLSGEMPTELGNLSNLEELWLGTNQLTGEMPTELGNLSSLEQVGINDNQLTGELPDSLTGLTMLEGLFFANNAGLCAPTDEAFQTWLQSVASVSGDNCVAEDSAEDRAVLVELYNATDGANWTDNTNWLSDEPMREWHGVVTDDEGRVAELSLDDNQLTGEIPTELGNLSNLTTMSLWGNQLTGEIPTELGNLSNLRTLILSINQLSGEIPTELGNLSNLQTLWLVTNQLTGKIPTELGNLSNLTGLSLSGNHQLTRRSWATYPTWGGDTDGVGQPIQPEDADPLK